MLKFYLVNRKELSGYFINKTIEYMVLGLENLKLRIIIEKLKAAATAAGPNTMCYQEIIQTINDLKQAAAECKLTAKLAWKLVTSITTKQRNTNQCMKEFVMNLQRLGALDYLLEFEEHETSTKNLFQGEILVDWDMFLDNSSKMSKLEKERRQKSLFMMVSYEKTINVFEFNLNGEFNTR